jgi:hypothetical protein
MALDEMDGTDEGFDAVATFDGGASRSIPATRSSRGR